MLKAWSVRFILGMKAVTYVVIKHAKNDSLWTSAVVNKGVNKGYFPEKN